MWGGFYFQVMWYRLQTWALLRLAKKYKFEDQYQHIHYSTNGYYLHLSAKEHRKVYLKNNQKHSFISLVSDPGGGLLAEGVHDPSYPDRTYHVGWGLLYNYDYTLRRKYDNRKVNTNGIIRELFKRYIGLPIWVSKFQRYKIKRYEAGLVLVSDSIAILNSYLECEVHEDRGEVSIQSILTNMYGDDFTKISAGTRAKFRRRVELISKALSETGELEQVRALPIFKVKGKALTTVLEYEHEQRKLREEKTHRDLVVALTVILAAASTGMLIIECVKQGWYPSLRVFSTIFS